MLQILHRLMNVDEAKRVTDALARAGFYVRQSLVNRTGNETAWAVAHGARNRQQARAIIRKALEGR